MTFNFTYNDALSEANYDEDKELKIYHLEEVMDKEGNKTDEVEVKEMKTRKSEENGGELVVNADKFSVYTVAGVKAPAIQSNQLDGWSY